MLQAEGLGELSAKSALSSKFRTMTAVELEAYTKAVEAWQAWAYRVLAEHLWWNDHEREIWRLYAEGVPTRAIPARVAATASRRRRRDPRSQRVVSDGRPSSRFAIQRIIARVKAEHPGPTSPWRRRQLAPASAEPPPAVGTIRRFAAAECRALEREIKPARKERP